MTIRREEVNFGPEGSGVETWLASIQDVFDLANGTDVLSQEELGFGFSLRQKSDAERFFAARMLLRIALSEATSRRITPSGWRFTAGNQGKPEVAEGLPHLEFNVSHSGSCVAVAISGKHPVGIDVEGIAPGDCHQALGEVLTPREADKLKQMDQPQQKLEFVRIWTVKEACVKALGHGIAMDFRSLEVRFYPGQPLQAFCHGDGLTFVVQAIEINCGNHPYFCSVTLMPDHLQQPLAGHYGCASRLPICPVGRAVNDRNTSHSEERTP